MHEQSLFPSEAIFMAYNIFVIYILNIAFRNVSIMFYLYNTHHKYNPELTMATVMISAHQQCIRSNRQACSLQLRMVTKEETSYQHTLFRPR